MSLQNSLDTVIHIYISRNNKSFTQRISAYAFNSDRVKSLTVSTTFKSVTNNSRKGRLVILAIGVGENLTPKMRLNHSQRDTEYFTKKICEIASIENFDSLITITLISQAVNSLFSVHKKSYLIPTKQNLELVFNILAGRTKTMVLNQKQLVQIMPDDVLIVFFSGHGITDSFGNFYLVPFNYNEDLPLNSSISSLELNDWMRNINAKQIYLFIDACYSGGIFADKYKPGPFGDSDFGQLSYDKRIPILAASQSKESIALSNGQGLISRSLFNQNNLVNSKNLYDLMVKTCASTNESTESQKPRLLYLHNDKPSFVILKKKSQK